MELADLPGHPARAIARRHKAAMEDWCAGLLERAHVAAPRERAREVVLLLEGTTALIVIHGNRGYADAAAEAAKRLLAPPGEPGRPKPLTKVGKPKPRPA
jgi:hypothetical protein